MTEAADKYARDSEHFQLEWGHALSYARHKDEAKKQFAIAASLDLPIANKSELVCMRPAHG